MQGLVLLVQVPGPGLQEFQFAPLQFPVAQKVGDGKPFHPDMPDGIEPVLFIGVFPAALRHALKIA
jgi:hypothetical protein